MHTSAADHALGLELQLEELVEQRRRAEVQGRGAEVARLDPLIAELTDELAATAEKLAQDGDIPAGPVIQTPPPGL